MKSPDTRPVTILLADDDPEDRMLTMEAFEAAHLGNQVRVVEDGVELMEYLRRKGKYASPESSPRPSIILLDLNMPRKSGWEALAEIRADPELARIRVVILTTSRAEEDVYRGYDHQVASYITKPVTFESLLNVIRVFKEYWLEIVELPAKV
jgi:CheY-like chemotaxis protein